MFVVDKARQKKKEIVKPNSALAILFLLGVFDFDRVQRFLVKYGVLLGAVYFMYHIFIYSK